MKISWGVKVILAFVIFAGGIITMVSASILNSTDLVSENYYEQEIKHQDQIDILNNSISIDHSILIETEPENILIKIAGNNTIQDLTGEIYFYKASDAKKDFRINFNPSEQGVQTIYSGEMERGSWKIQLSLTDGKKQYFVERNIFI